MSFVRFMNLMKFTEKMEKKKKEKNCDLNYDPAVSVSKSRMRPCR